MWPLENVKLPYGLYLWLTLYFSLCHCRLCWLSWHVLFYNMRHSLIFFCDSHIITEPSSMPVVLYANLSRLNPQWPSINLNAFGLLTIIRLCSHMCCIIVNNTNSSSSLTSSNCHILVPLLCFFLCVLYLWYYKVKSIDWNNRIW